jgi:hypothetical protein
MCFASDSIACFAKFSGYGTVRVSCFNNHQAKNTIHHTACISINKALILTEFSTALPCKNKHRNGEFSHYHAQSSSR